MEVVFLVNGRYFKTVAVPHMPYSRDIFLHIPTSNGGIRRVGFNGVMLACPPDTERMIYVAEIPDEEFAALRLPVYVEKED